jgi:hypothetical protein
VSKRELDEQMRAARLSDAQQKAAQLFAAVSRAGILQAGKSDSVASDGGERVMSLITGANPLPLRREDPSGRVAHWILEVHIVDQQRQIEGFYEELLTI